ncbi:MAG: hypothetical protein EOO41_03720 [Methanobacteriota archaeon]|nr:MAG: hypothetical protein EOO41_03720 [Euryarchaeota archaeon]
MVDIPNQDAAMAVHIRFQGRAVDTPFCLLPAPSASLAPHSSYTISATTSTLNTEPMGMYRAALAARQQVYGSGRLLPVDVDALALGDSSARNAMHLRFGPPSLDATLTATSSGPFAAAGMSPAAGSAGKGGAKAAAAAAAAAAATTPALPFSSNELLLISIDRSAASHRGVAGSALLRAAAQSAAAAVGGVSPLLAAAAAPASGGSTGAPAKAGIPPTAATNAVGAMGAAGSGALSARPGGASGGAGGGTGASASLTLPAPATGCAFQVVIPASGAAMEDASMSNEGSGAGLSLPHYFSVEPASGSVPNGGSAKLQFRFTPPVSDVADAKAGAFAVIAPGYWSHVDAKVIVSGNLAPGLPVTTAHVVRLTAYVPAIPNVDKF